MGDTNQEEDYKQHFSPLLYLQRYYSDIEGNILQDILTTKMQFWHEVFVDGKIKGRRLLDIGTGPSVHSIISASPHCDVIYLTDFAPQNREALKQWLRRDLQHSFESFFRFVVNREGKGQLWDERENQLRRKVSGILRIDLRQDDPLAPNAMSKFDIITSSLCLEAASKDIAGYEDMAKRVEALLKDDGHVILYGHIGEQTYTVGEHPFPVVGINKEQRVNVLFHDVLINVGDITRDTSRKTLVEATRKKFGKIDILVNNAGIGGSSPLQSATKELYDSIMAVNLEAPVFLTQLVAPYLIESKGSGSGYLHHVEGGLGHIYKIPCTLKNISESHVLPTHEVIEFAVQTFVEQASDNRGL